MLRYLILAWALIIAPTATADTVPKPAAPDSVTEPQELNFAIVPQQSASRLARGWSPLLGWLSEQTGASIKFVTTKDIPTFEACLRSGAFDIAYMNPYHYTVFSEDGNYRAIAHQADKKLRGLMVVREDSEITDIAALDGSVIAFPSPGAFGASVLPRAEMIKREIDFEPRYVKSHDSVYRAVAAGFVAAGGGVTRTLNAAPAELKDKLRVIYQTEAYTPHAIAVHARVSEEPLAKLTEALIDVRESNPELLGSLGVSGFVAASHETWDDVRSLGLKPEQAGLDRLNEIVCPFD